MGAAHRVGRAGWAPGAGIGPRGRGLGDCGLRDGSGQRARGTEAIRPRNRGRALDSSLHAGRTKSYPTDPSDLVVGSRKFPIAVDAPVQIRVPPPVSPLQCPCVAVCRGSLREPAPLPTPIGPPTQRGARSVHRGSRENPGIAPACGVLCYFLWTGIPFEHARCSEWDNEAHRADHHHHLRGRVSFQQPPQARATGLAAAKKRAPLARRPP